MGFEIIYQEENSSEINIDEEFSESSEDSIFFNPVYKKLYILENISLHKTKSIYDVILSIPKKKFLIMRNKNNKENIKEMIIKIYLLIKDIFYFLLN